MSSEGARRCGEGYGGVDAGPSSALGVPDVDYPYILNISSLCGTTKIEQNDATSEYIGLFSRSGSFSRVHELFRKVCASWHAHSMANHNCTSSVLGCEVKLKGPR